ncbi:MAG: DUF3109 family protein [Flavobacteriales bacterium]|nr:DUF3109 family protein [Flavobacteriales bacterium]
MIIVEDTLVSEDILDVKFVCDLKACKGKCCVAGDEGAPLEEDEIEILEEIRDKVEPYMTEEGKAAIAKQGVYVVTDDNELATPLVGDEQCAYVFFEKGTAKCAIERAESEGKIDFKKPISCHLYPIRITKNENFDAVNYHKWVVCEWACVYGDKLDVPVYEFLKEPLIRKFGQDWYTQIEIAAELKKQSKQE